MTAPSGYLFSDTVTVVNGSTAQATDEYGNETTNWPAATRTTHMGRMEPPFLAGGAQEAERDRSTMIAEWTLFLPPDAQITGIDRVEYDGETFEVVGPPARLKTPRGAHHVYAKCRWVSG